MNAVAVMPPDQGQALAPVNDTAALMTAIAQAARDPQVDVEKMERLMAMHRDLKTQAAEVAFNEAMAIVQSSMGRIGTDKRNNQTHSDYATYGKLDRVLRPLYTKEGFALSFGTDPVEIAEMVRVTCHVTHRAGFTRKYLIDMPADGKGAKGNDVMTKTHATGSATQYGMRYLLKMIFNVATADEDDDGNGASGLDTLDQKAEDWIRVAKSLQTPPEYNNERKRMKADYDDDATKIPAAVVKAFNDARAAVMPKD